jgi:hypothetical protein
MSKDWDVTEIREFVLTREQEEGGFSFAEAAPPTLEDTYYALRTLRELNIDYDNEKTFEYIKNFDVGNVTLKQIFHLLYLIHAFDLKYPIYSLKNSIRKGDNMNITDAYYLILSLDTLNEHSGRRLRDFIVSKNITSLKHVSEVSRQVILLKKLNVCFDGGFYVRWIQNCQNYDGGFGFNHGSTSFMENCYYALRALYELKSIPSETERCNKFILYCRARNGGFGRQIISLPTLEATYHAVKSLTFLQKMVFDHNYSG